MRDHGSIGLPLGMGSFGGFFGFWLIWFFFWLSSFSVLVWREANKSPTHRILVGNQREKTTLGHGFFFFLLFIWWQFCFLQILSGQKTFLHTSSIFFQSLIRSFLSFCFYFLPFFGWEFSFFSFCFSPTLWLEIFLLSLFLLPRVRIMVSQDFGSRLVEWLDMIHVRFGLAQV